MTERTSETPAPPATSAHPLRPAVVLVRPQEEGNVGQVARAMANMGLDELILVEPAAPIGDVARARAVRGAFVLDAAVRVGSLAEALEGVQFVAATTSARARTVERRHRTARELAAELAAAPAMRAALLFGPEVSGLSVEELSLAQVLVTVPTDPACPVLNLAQAVLLVTYELFQVRPEALATVPLEEDHRPAAAAQVEGLMGQVEALLRQVRYARDTTFPGVMRELRALAAKASLTEREVRILRGICRRLGWALAPNRGEGGV
jgi:TrmH family RNA methyltransferase